MRILHIHIWTKINFDIAHYEYSYSTLLTRNRISALHRGKLGHVPFCTKQRPDVLSTQVPHTRSWVGKASGRPNIPFPLPFPLLRPFEAVVRPFEVVGAPSTA